MKSVADIIIEHIEPMQCIDIQPIQTNFDEVIKRYMDFQVRYDFTTSDKYKALTKLYARSIKEHEIKLGLSYRVWSDEVMYKFESDFSSKYIRPYT
ncbi:MAG: hypothetical protein ACRDA3_00130 [Peptostreptococcaceae bacterium]